MRYLIPALLSAAVIIAATTLQSSAESADTSHPAALVIIEFNEAVTTRDMDTALALLAEGGVQFNLHPAHPGMPVDHPLTEDMPTMWKTVSAILFPTTEAYERIVQIDNVHSDGELAVVWTQTKTITHRKGIAEPMILNFSEMYFLVNKDNTGWRIAGTATNRPIDSISVG